MEAIVCFAPNNFKYVSDYTGIPSISATEVLVKVLCCGVNFPDTLIVQGKYQYHPPYPFSPGGEISGIVVKIGEKVTRVKIGQRVIGITVWGGFASYAPLKEDHLIPLPDTMDPIVGSGLLITYGTSYYGLKERANLKPGETVLVLGAAGGIGIATIELAKLMGAKVVACASTDKKLETCKKYGADMLINYSKENWEKKIKELFPNGIDVVFDPVGGEFTEKALRQIAWNGRYLVVGFAAGTIPALELNLVLLKGCSVIGIFLGRFMDLFPYGIEEGFKQLTLWHASGQIKPYISEVYPLEMAHQALEHILQRNVEGKIVLTTQNYQSQMSKL